MFTECLKDILIEYLMLRYIIKIIFPTLKGTIIERYCQCFNSENEIRSLGNSNGT